MGEFVIGSHTRRFSIPAGANFSFDGVSYLCSGNLAMSELVVFTFPINLQRISSEVAWKLRTRIEENHPFSCYLEY
jgi:hypothetical protein